jgi:ABC-type transporter Mla maintaining outer membrane lipid asymmetry ATPase subunit MlaF
MKPRGDKLETTPAGLGESTTGGRTASAPNAGAEPALQMTNVTVGALQDADRIVFEDVNWSVAPGDFWAIGGLHASGKTDLMALTAGLTRPVRGSYRVFGRELTTGFEPDLLDVRLRIGLVFDGGKLLNHLTVAENVALPIGYHRDIDDDETGAEVERLLNATGLTLWAERMPGTVSRNWQQRVGLARALALKPEVLLLDSPLSGLDPREVGWWVEFLGQLAAGHPLFGGRAVTLVVSGDNLRPWKGLARQFAVLRGRRFVPLGSGGEAAARDDFLRDLFGT